MNVKQLPTEVIQAELDYNPDTGEFIWKAGRKGRRKKAGSKNVRGYIIIGLDGTTYFAHRLAWLLHTGEDVGDRSIDHINGDKSDNRIVNLRVATHGENLIAAQHSAKGICKRKNRWEAKIRIKGTKWTAQFDCPLIAHIAYVDKRKEMCGEWAKQQR